MLSLQDEHGLSQVEARAAAIHAPSGIKQARK